jgi:pimeloyl-ACP methyl ester carboxylesterase
MKVFGRLALGAGVMTAAAAAGLAAFTRWNTGQAERLVPPDGRFVTLSKALIHFVDEGAGPPIVMVHGLGGQLRNLTYGLSGALAPHHRVITLDRPGSGYSLYTGDGDPGLAEQAAIVVELIRELGLDRPLLVGHSMGGAIALAAALNHPEAIGGLALLAPLTRPIDDVPDVFRALTITAPMARALVGNLLAAPLGRLNSDMSNATIFGPEPFPVDFDVRGGAALTLRPEAFAAACADAAACQADMPALARRYGDLRLPVGILFGKGDLLLAPDVHGAVTARAIPDAQYTAIDGGHMFPVTQPARTAQWIIEQAARISA